MTDYVEQFQTTSKEEGIQFLKDILSDRALDTLEEIQKEYVTEVSKSTLGSYIKKASIDAAFKGMDAGYKRADTENNTNGPMHNRLDAGIRASIPDKVKAGKRLLGVAKAVGKLTEESIDEMSQEDFDSLVEDYEQLDELNKATLGSYIKKASRDAKFTGYNAGYADAHTTAHTRGSMENRLNAGTAAAAENDDKAHKRLKGVSKAVDKIMKEDFELLSEYHAKGTVGDHKFKIATDDVYSESDVKKQNPHLSDKHVKAIVAHTESDEFLDDQTASTTQHGLKVKSSSGGSFGDFSETKKKLK